MGFSVQTISQQQEIQLHVEPGRIVSQRRGECNYNVFYELCSTVNASDKRKLGLKSEQYFYLNQVNVELQ
ncbi:unnamed protein product [Litomosoides sigmodontis]|uniref:Uncharacterized protein n=1 Tax=Litomosoides sigmodontis TaxID=42156 RepID=A0A3P7JR38_LITSI|nr:unnamed protein product [Litomosoides sigmodontis]